MSTLDVRLVTLAPLRVASFYGFGPSPELVAWEKLVAWSRPKGLLDLAASARIFGFNNPSPSVGSPNYGYEFWLEVGAEVAVAPEDEAEVKIVHFAGGRYAVARCQGVEAIPSTWQALVNWLANSSCQPGSHQWLEEHLGPVDAPVEAWALDLYAPIAD
jgi:DNA gyrase inhibitor GyrI